MVEKGPEEYLFDHKEATDCEGVVVQPIHGMKAENQVAGSNKEGNFPFLTSVQITNPMEDSMAVFCFI